MRPRTGLLAAALCAVLRPCGGWVSLIGGPSLQQRCAPPRAVATRPPSATGSPADAPTPQNQQQQQQQQVAGALERMLPDFDSNRIVGEESVATACAATPLPGSWYAQDAVGNAAVLARREELLVESYEACRHITEQYAKTFYFGTTFFDEDKRKAVWAIYAWCRRTDDIVDKPRKESGSLRSELSQWGARLKDVWRGRPHDLIDLALVDTLRKYPELSIEPFEDMIKGMVRERVTHAPPTGCSGGGGARGGSGARARRGSAAHVARPHAVACCAGVPAPARPPHAPSRPLLTRGDLRGVAAAAAHR
jgi:hypothetical protein